MLCYFAAMANDTSAPLSAPPVHVLETEQRFSSSILWALTRRYYEQRGIGAWDAGQVPFYVTSNPYIARCYAHLVLAYLRDCLAAGSLDPRKPVFIIEAAAGHGRFAYLFLKKLMALKANSGLRHLDVRYLMTDLADSNVEAWRKQRLFKPFIDSGVLDFALYDVERDAAPRALTEGAPGPLQDHDNPLVVLANYIFDTTAADLFRIERGRLLEGFVTIRSPEPFDAKTSDPALMSSFTYDYQYRPVPDGAPYADPLLNQILDGYRQRMGDTSFVFPVGAIAAVRNLNQLSRGRFLLLSSDKGYTHEDELLYLDDPSIQFHGSMSVMVNYHAIGGYIGALGGLGLCTSQRHVSLKTAAFMLGGEFPEVRTWFNEEMDGFGPYDLYRLTSSDRADCPSRSIEHCLCLLRLSEWDPAVLIDSANDLREHMDQATEGQRHALLQAIERVWENFYPMNQDLPFEIARILLTMKRPRDAIRYNQRSIELFGDHAVTFLNMGICHFHAEEPEAALRWFNRALDLAPDYAPARSWKVRIESAWKAAL